MTGTPPGGFRFDADGRGRPVLAEGWLYTHAGARDGSAQHAVAGGLPDFHAGHLIPSRFGGPGDRRNLVPMSAVTNTSYIASIENAIARHLKSGPVYLRVTVEYRDTSRIPDFVTHSLFRADGRGGLTPIDGGCVVTAVGASPSAKMSAVRDPYTGRAIAPKEWLDPRSTKGLGPHGFH